MGEVHTAVELYKQQLAQLEKKLSTLEQKIKNLELSEKHYRLMVENAGEAIVILQGRHIKYLNPKAAALVGVEREELINARFERFIHPDDKPFVLSNYERRLKGFPVIESYSFRIVDVNGKTKWVHIRPVRIFYEGKPALLEFLVDITRQKQLEIELEKTNGMLTAAIESLSEAILITDLNLGVILFNTNFLNVWKTDRLSLLDRDYFIKRVLRMVKQPDEFTRKLEQIISSPDSEFSGRLELKDGRYYEWYTKPFHIAKTTAGRVWTLKDITYKIKTEFALREREKKYRELVENINSIVLRWKPDGTITYINRYGSRFFGYSRKELVGKTVFETILPETDTEGRNLHQLIDSIVNHPEKFQNNENENITKDGKRVWILWKNRGVYDKNNRLVEILSIGNDITEKRKMEKRLEKLATTDSLTGLINRMRFEQILEEHMKAFEKNGKQFSLFLFDIDNFKKINDTYGHNVGDSILVKMAETVRKELRENDIFCRWGGEEFFILFPETEIGTALAFSEQIRNSIGGKDFYPVGTITISGGLTSIHSGDTTFSLISRADRLLYTAKNSGKNRVIWE